MAHFRVVLGTATIAAALVSSPSAPLGAATSGLAYDTVTKFQKSGDDTPQPGTFSSDFEAASQPANGSDAPRGPFGLGRAMAQAQAAMAVFKTGSAQHEYVAGSKQRIDRIAMGQAEITDCSARTLTTLDLKKKTYTVTSLDAPIAHGSSGNHRAEQPAPAATDDGSKVAVALTTKSLGPKNIDGIATSGYDSDVKTTVTKPGSDPKTVDMGMTAYYTAYARPALVCPEAATRTVPANGPGAGAMAQYLLAMRAVRAGGSDGRFSATSSGPPLPAGKLPLFETIAMKGSGGDSAFIIVMERGNVHPITENDPIFTVPADFTKE